MELNHFLLFILFIVSFRSCRAGNSKLFREYIGAESTSVKLTDVPINSNVEFHFILAFAIDYNYDNSKPSPTNGKFNIFWENNHLNPKEIASIKSRYKNVKIAVSLGGDTVGKNKYVYFKPKSINSWVDNAVSSLSSMIEEYNIDGIDIDYEHFSDTNTNIFAECIGQLVTKLKKSGKIQFASIAPFEDNVVQSHYMTLWKKYGQVIDYVNFQFYAYNKIDVTEFVRNFNKQASNYEGGQILASFVNKGGGLGPKDGFFEACKELKGQGKLGGIFVWCADESTKTGFKYEKMSQNLLASS
ncbi:chitinase 2-like [Nicotiana tabacum]|uniref:Chitinase 2-like n=2 Tax=Nicotiana TaxID=4085 RepID=A0A1S4D4P3_TOBAC|nr:PREDICTED: chitinase 2-like [Nicotiana sylvestris]XP_016508244.1 PREDICTED: chitinase 2-like [Nicotiana tabacum]